MWNFFGEEPELIDKSFIHLNYLLGNIQNFGHPSIGFTLMYLALNQQLIRNCK